MQKHSRSRYPGLLLVPDNILHLYLLVMYLMNTVRDSSLTLFRSLGTVVSVPIFTNKNKPKRLRKCI